MFRAESIQSMLVPFVLPLQITFAIFAVVMAVIALSPRRRKSFSLSLFMAVVLFTPSCIGVSLVVDAFRYGRFEYASASESRDPYLQIPPASTGIVLHRFASGHAVRFQSNRDDLMKWMDAVTEHRTQFSDATPFVLDQELHDDDVRAHLWKSHFGRWGWTMPNDVVRYRGWRSARGAGFDVWYSASTETGFISASYW